MSSSFESTEGEAFELTSCSIVNVAANLVVPIAFFLYAGKWKCRCGVFLKGAEWAVWFTYTINMIIWITLVSVQRMYYPNTMYKITVIPLFSIYCLLLCYIPIGIRCFIIGNYTFFMGAITMTSFEIAQWNLYYVLLNANSIVDYGDWITPLAILSFFGLFAPLGMVRAHLCCYGDNTTTCHCAVCCPAIDKDQCELIQVEDEPNHLFLSIFEDDLLYAEEEGAAAPEGTLAEPLLSREKTACHPPQSAASHPVIIV